MGWFNNHPSLFCPRQGVSVGGVQNIVSNLTEFSVGCWVSFHLSACALRHYRVVLIILKPGPSWSKYISTSSQLMFITRSDIRSLWLGRAHASRVTRKRKGGCTPIGHWRLESTFLVIRVTLFQHVILKWLQTLIDRLQENSPLHLDRFIYIFSL